MIKYNKKAPEMERIRGKDQKGNPSVEHRHTGHNYWHPKQRMHSNVFGEIIEKIDVGIRVHCHPGHDNWHPCSKLHLHDIEIPSRYRWNQIVELKRICGIPIPQQRISIFEV